jgi:hypothetical protein
MKRENVNVMHNHTSQLTKKSKDQQHEQTKVIPQTGTDTGQTKTGGSMSEGNLSNNRYGRERTRSLHDKQFVMGSDNDGQSN